MSENTMMRRLNAAKEEDRAELMDFLGGEKFVSENMPYKIGRASCRERV